MYQAKEGMIPARIHGQAAGNYRMLTWQKREHFL
jgi:hypothetical protein